MKKWQVIMRNKIISGLFFCIVSTTAFASLSNFLIARGYTTDKQPFIAVSNDQGYSWTAIQSAFQNNPSIHIAASVSSGGKVLGITSGFSFQGSTRGYLKTSTDGGKSWIDKPLSELVPSGVISPKVMGGDCSANNGDLACIVAVEYENPDKHGIDPAVIAYTNDGTLWKTSAISNLPSNVTSISVRQGPYCSDMGNCFAMGYTNTFTPFILTSADQGIAWSFTEFPASFFRPDGTCTGKNPTMTYVILLDANTDNPLKIQVSNDSGKTWANKQINFGKKDQSIQLSSLSCTGNGVNAICVIAGNEREATSYGSNGLTPVIASSKDGGNTWSVKNLFDSGVFESVSCTGEKESSLCVAIGNEERVNSQGFAYVIPRIFVSRDGGDTWNPKSISNFSDGMVLSTTCNTSDSQTVCTIDGYEIKEDKYVPMMAVSTDMGNTWVKKTIQGISPSTQGMLY